MEEQVPALRRCRLRSLFAQTGCTLLQSVISSVRRVCGVAEERPDRLCSHGAGLGNRGRLMHERVAIVGGGPAGCSAALRCSQHGLPVVLFEAGGRYRDKPCGDALVASAVTCARSFGLTDHEFLSLGGRPFAHIDVELNRSPSAVLRLLHPGGWVIPRAALDQALRDAVSRTCDVRYNAVVRRLLPTSSGISVMVSQSGRTNELFGAAIIATGAVSRLSQVLGIDGHPKKGLAFRGYVPKPDSRDALLFEVSGGPTLQYRWVFPIGEKANIGACRLGDCIPESKGATTLALRGLAACPESIKLTGGVEPLWSGSASKWHHAGGVVSCGDCAGLVDPITGEGITAAFVSGDMAACAVAGYLGGQGAVALERFSLRVGEVFSERYNADRERDLLRLLSSFG